MIQAQPELAVLWRHRGLRILALMTLLITAGAVIEILPTAQAADGGRDRVDTEIQAVMDQPRTV